MKYYVSPFKDNTEQNETLRDKIERIDNFVRRFEESDEKEIKKNFKLPKTISLFHKKKLKKGYVLVFLLKTNGQIDIKFLQIKTDIISIKENKTLHLSGARYMFRYKGFPAIILPEYSLEPLDPRNVYMKVFDQKKLAWPQEEFLRAIKEGEVKHKKSFGGAIWIIIGIAVIAGLYFLSTLIKK